MTCPTIDKLSRYVDNLLTEQELVEIRKHMESCEECLQIVDVFKGEEQFIKETLETPRLSDNFTNLVLGQLEPYELQKKRRRPWKQIMLAAAGGMLAVGLSATFNPSFAAWVGDLFTTEQVDEGVRMANDAGLTERVNLEVMDRGITLKVEDVMADSSRILLSYQILNGKGKVQKKQDLAGLDGDEIIVTDQNGKVLEGLGWTWQSVDDYGLYEFFLGNHPDLESITVHFNVKRINGVKGNWQLDVPVALKKSNELTTTLPLNGMKTSEHGVNVHLKEIKFAPSSHQLFYETSFTDEAREQIAQEVIALEEKYGKEIVDSFMNYENSIQYHIKNAKNEVVFQNHIFYDREENLDASAYLQGEGELVGQMGHIARYDAFTSQEADEQLTFVLDGIIKTVPTDFSVTVKPKELKKQPISFEYEGNFVEIPKIEKQSDYYLRKSLIPIGKRTYFTIKMEGDKESFAPELGRWALVDDKGNAHVVYSSGSILDKTLTVYGLDKIPEEFTLHLLSVTRYEEVEEKWEVPLH